MDVNRVKKALSKLKEINWFYKDVDDDSVDECAKKVIEVCDSATGEMIEKVTPQDIASFQAYAIRQLDPKISPTCDIDHYKLLNVDEDEINSRQEHLDVMCFPALFPDGKFGQHYRRENKVSASEYAKSRLLNKDSRYVFYLLWQEELRQLSAGIYNLLKSDRGSRGMTVDRFLGGVNNSNEDVEANLSTVFMSMRGTKQYWFIRSSELKCMVREWGTPTLSLSLSAVLNTNPPKSLGKSQQRAR